MPRPPLPRTICGRPGASRYKPSGIPARHLREVILGYDELEALRLADLEGLYHQEAAEHMGISRPTFGRLVSQARHKVADALFHGQSLAFEGGPVTLAPGPWHRCDDCGLEWQGPVAGDAAAVACSTCGSDEVIAGPLRPAPVPVTPGRGGAARGHGPGGGRRSGGGGRRGGRGRGASGNRAS